MILAGCAAPETAHHSKAPHAKPSATPTAAAPSVRVPVGCADLFSDSVAATLLGTPVAFRWDESTLPKDIDSIAERQYGALQCFWAGPDRPDGGYAEYFGVTITPDATAAFNANIANLEQQDPPSESGVAGDQSEISCSASQDVGLFCDSNMLVGSYWVEVDLNPGVFRPEATGNAQVKAALVTIAGKLAGTTAGAKWKPGASAMSPFCSDGQRAASAAALNAAVGRTDLTYDPGEAVPSSAATVPQQSGNYASCDWDTDASDGAQGDFNSLSITLLNGGAWVMPLLLANLGEDSLQRGPFTRLTVPGVGTAAYQCAGETDTCSVLVADGSLLIGLRIGDTTTTALDPAIVGILTAVAKTNP